jgi:ATP-dependent RNA helicase RhlB
MSLLSRVKAIFTKGNKGGEAKAEGTPRGPRFIDGTKGEGAGAAERGERKGGKGKGKGEGRVERGGRGRGRGGERRERRGEQRGERRERGERNGGGNVRRAAGHQEERKAVEDNWDISEYQVPEAEGKTRFLDFGLLPELVHAVADEGFRYATPIQAQALPHALDGKDVCGRAQTGTGKTAAFLLAVFQHLITNEPARERRKGYPRALVMAPTRELCMQIEKDGEALARHTGLRLLAVYGGMDLQAQRAALRDRYIDVVVATPGRLLDFKQRQDVDFSHVEILVIDEADRMLDMGFIPDMRRIVFGCPPKDRRQTMLFSATLTPDVTRLASQWMRGAVTVDIEPEHVAAETIDQRVYIVTEDQKFTIVYNILKKVPFERVIIFGNRRSSTERLCEELRWQGISTALLNGDVSQEKRVQVLENFREGRVPVLVATDVAGRGLHIDGVDLIINYNVPTQAEDYVHRIGRTGRVGEKGVSVTFADELDSYGLPAIEEYMKQPLHCVPPPDEWLEAPPKAMPERRERRGGGGGGGRRDGGGRGPRGRGPRGGGRGGRGPRR